MSFHEEFLCTLTVLEHLWIRGNRYSSSWPWGRQSYRERINEILPVDSLQTHRKWGRSSSVCLNQYLSGQRWRKWVLSCPWTVSNLQADKTKKIFNKIPLCWNIWRIIHTVFLVVVGGTMTKAAIRFLYHVLSCHFRHLIISETTRSLWRWVLYPRDFL